jgi:tetratricopeptide (TPR) repeat protein
VSSKSSRRIALLAALAAVVAIAAAAAFLIRSFTRLPAPGSDTYEQVTRAFYHGVAALEVGLLDDARTEFTTVTTRVPDEPAGWANLGLTHLRLGELDAAAMPVEKALMLAPDNALLELLAGRMEVARGRLDEGLAHLRRAVELDPKALQPRYALAEEIERGAAADADAQALAQMDELARLAPRNMAVLVERARIAAKAQDLARLNVSIGLLQPMAANWPEPAKRQFQELLEAVARNDMNGTQRATAFLRNVLARVPAFGEDLSAIRTPTELISEPFEKFIALPSPPATPAEPDLALTFSEEPIAPTSSVWVDLLFTLPPQNDKESPRLFSTGLAGITALTGPSMRVPFTTSATDVGPNPHIVAVGDWNNDFRPDIITGMGGGVRLLLQQSDGGFIDQTPDDPMAAACRCTGVWAADVEMDGDLDVVASPEAGATFVLRNNGDGSWTSVRMFQGLNQVVDFAWADLDDDGDSDAVFLDRAGNGSTRLSAFANRQAGDFVPLPALPVSSPHSMTISDMDSDGVFDIVVCDLSGTLRAISLHDDQWRAREIAKWPGKYVPYRLIAADFDNNGAVDLVGTGGETRIWLNDAAHQLHLVERAIPGTVYPAGDLNADGRIDLVGVAPAQKFLEPAAPGLPRVPDPRPSREQQFVRLLNRGTANYHWKEFRPRAQETAGDQRINSFGIGGYIEARSGLMFQKQLLTGGPVHIGLGTHTTIDVARIVWPNGVPQAEFGTDVDNAMVAEQRLKGSCPWLFAWDGTRMRFVTDFLWRSPLGLRINAQDTAGVSQTEDWVRIPQLAPLHGMYDLRITAELWETHFFDHVSLMAVDHPGDTSVFVDERFSPASPPALKVHALKSLRNVTGAWDHHGMDVTAVVAENDGNYLSTFQRGRYQGIAEDHYVEFETAAIDADSLLIATGWIYPTDSSINVAIAQAGINPRGLSLEAQNPDRSWRVVNPDLGFPAGKNKTIVVDLSGAAGARRLRLRTNLEIYWDSLRTGTRASSPVPMTRARLIRADLRYRGFSRTTSPRGDAPETPEYDRLESSSPRWRDLTGYHTRFGDVRELVEQVDDRYVIMNAGDELRLQFAEVPPAGSGWRRDFVVIGDGWEKDGDYNTRFSQTVLPLPSHDRPNYGAGTTTLALEDDPVYQRYRDDWQHYHTRYVTPQRFLRGLRP